MTAAEVLYWISLPDKLMRSTGVHPIVFGIVAGVALGLLGSFFQSAFERAKSLFTRWRRPLNADPEYRKLRAKKHNEHLKLIGSFCNTLGAAVIGAAFIVPYIGNHVTPDQVDPRWVGVGLVLPLAGHIALRFMKSE